VVVICYNSVDDIMLTHVAYFAYKTCIVAKQTNFNCRTFISTDIIETLLNYIVCE